MAERTCAACDCKLEGDPIQVRIGGRAVEVCCEDCAQKLREASASTSESRSSAARGRSLSVLVALCAAASIGGASDLQAAEPDSNVGSSIRVSYADLDLATTEGVETLYRRIEQAARLVCKPHGVRLSAIVQREYSKCLDASMAAAGLSVGNARLASMLASAASARQ